MSKHWEKKKERRRAKWAKEDAANGVSRSGKKKVHKPELEVRRERCVRTICAVRKPRKKKIGLGDRNFRPMVSLAQVQD